MMLLRRRQRRPIQSADDEYNDSSATTSNPLDRLSERNSLQKKLFIVLYISIFILSIDLLLTITRKTWWPYSSLPLIQHVIHTPGSDGTYAQNYQDTWIIKLATTITRRSQQSASASSTLDNRPFFLDIGAYHGLWCSNSYLLEQRYQWKGACVEPFPDGFQQRSCQLFVNAMSDTDGIEVDFSGAGQERTIGLVTNNNNSNNSASSSSKQAIRRGKSFQMVATTISFPTLLKQSNAPYFIDFISLDVEGHEYTVLSKFPWTNYKVAAWIIEGHSNQVKELLESNGYKQRPVRNKGVDEYYVSDEYWSEEMMEKEWREHPFLSWGC